MQMSHCCKINAREHDVRTIHLMLENIITYVTDMSENDLLFRDKKSLEC